MPENTVSVTRPGKWGNPLKADPKFMPNTVVKIFRECMMDLTNCDKYGLPVDKFRYMRDRIFDLRGKNLACFCPIGSPCHADVLIELSNPYN